MRKTIIELEIEGSRIRNAERFVRTKGKPLKKKLSELEPKEQEAVRSLFAVLSRRAQQALVPSEETLETYLGAEYSSVMRNAFDSMQANVGVPLEYVTIENGSAYLKVNSRKGAQQIPIILHPDKKYDGFLAAAQSFFSYLPEYNKKLARLKENAAQATQAYQQQQRELNTARKDLGNFISQMEAHSAQGEDSRGGKATYHSNRAREVQREADKLRPKVNILSAAVKKAEFSIRQAQNELQQFEALTKPENQSQVNLDDAIISMWDIAAKLEGEGIATIEQPPKIYSIDATVRKEWFWHYLPLRTRVAMAVYAAGMVLIAVAAQPVVSYFANNIEEKAQARIEMEAIREYMEKNTVITTSVWPLGPEIPKEVRALAYIAEPGKWYTVQASDLRLMPLTLESCEKQDNDSNMYLIAKNADGTITSGFCVNDLIIKGRMPNEIRHILAAAGDRYRLLSIDDPSFKMPLFLISSMPEGGKVSIRTATTLALLDAQTKERVLLGIRPEPAYANN